MRADMLRDTICITPSTICYWYSFRIAFILYSKIITNLRKPFTSYLQTWKRKQQHIKNNPVAKRTVIWPSKRQKCSLATFIRLIYLSGKNGPTYRATNYEQWNYPFKFGSLPLWISRVRRHSVSSLALNQPNTLITQISAAWVANSHLSLLLCTS